VVGVCGAAAAAAAAAALDAASAAASAIEDTGDFVSDVATVTGAESTGRGDLRDLSSDEGVKVEGAALLILGDADESRDVDDWASSFAVAATATTARSGSALTVSFISMPVRSLPPLLWLVLKSQKLNLDPRTPGIDCGSETGAG
jgi:hypothetical protein